MVNFTVDYNNTFGKAVEEAGSYNVKIMDSSTAKQTKKGKEMAVLNYEVLDGKYAGAAIRYHNIVWDDSTEEALSLSIKRLNTLMKAIGAEDGKQVNATMEAIVKQLHGKKLNITVDWEQSDYNGKWNLDVKSQQELKEKSEPNGVFRPNGTKKAAETSTNPFGNSNQSKQEATNPFEQTTLENTDPFAKNSTTIDIPDKDLPF
ncbi:DUF669 domain-containing protein [Lactobacillus salivarius]|uniref:DUF669 domain-containing protein n=1 Tax=Ligilactobacillus salivarius TaxID=1624 RepID=UPI00136A677C|nr:DUF669 domain-containing protein [Ligilactobacillus salivarius]MYV13632.1 DUF669 domain-containing protein [Ligilactobacillus salivarius]